MRPNLQHFKQIRRRRDGTEARGLANRAECESLVAVGCERFEALRSAPVLRVAIRHWNLLQAFARVGLSDGHEPVGIRVREWRPKEGVDAAEDAGVHPDAKRENQDGDEGKGLVLGERTAGENQFAVHDGRLYAFAVRR